jgi:hypothetical protein
MQIIPHLCPASLGLALYCAVWLHYHCCSLVMVLERVLEGVAEYGLLLLREQRCFPWLSTATEIA